MTLSRKALATAVLIAVIAGVYVVDLIVGGSDGDPIPLDAVEVREYRGERLSSIDDFRENSIRGPQHLSAASYRLAVGGLVDRPREYTYDEVLRLFPRYRKPVTLFCVEGWDVTILWDGVMVRDLLADAGTSPNATTVIFTAADGYSTSLPLDYVVNREILIAYAMNNVTLPAERGFPFQLVAEDRWGYKWAKWITGIELSDDASYRGYWESRGYANNGSIDQPFIEGR